MPAAMQANYKLFASKCSKCHTIARPINTMMKRDEWERYVKRMMHKPNSGISDNQGKQIFEFLIFDQTERKDKNPKTFFPALSDEEKARLTAQGNRLAQKLDRRRREYQEDLNAAQGEILSSLETKMRGVVQRYAQENNYATILDSSAQNSPVLYASKNIDVTQDLVRLYDQAHPAKAPAPATTTPPGAKPQ